VADSPEQYGYAPETWERAGVAARDQARAVFGKVMFLVAVTAGFTAAGAWIGRDLSGGWAIGAWIAAIVLTFVIGGARRKEEATPLQMGLLFGIGLLLGLAIGPTLSAYASLEDGGTLIAQAAGATALFMGVLGTVGYVTKRDLTALGRISFIALLALLVFGIVAIFVSIPDGNVIYAVAGLGIFGAFTIFDFNRLRRADASSAVGIAASIFLDVFNVFLLLLSLFGGQRD
jgi:FtsH-binding integral membrane protein